LTLTPTLSQGRGSTYVGRFAPSPTGPMHFGSLVAALASWLDARAHGGRWLVRIEDVDGPRTVAGADREILRALEAFGLEWDGEVVWQGTRTPIYEAALARLRESGHVYRCRCSRREIADSALAGLEGAVYPGTCRALALGSDVAGADRLRVGDGVIRFRDRVQGEIEQRLASEIGDFVLRRRDGLHAYQLAVVLDDGEQGVTDVVRGADLLDSMPRQILLQRLLGLPEPRYLHVPVATNERGEKLSKQTLADPVNARDAGELVRQALRFLGQSAPRDATPREMLVEATLAWDVSGVPATRAASWKTAERGGM
jgi:glutamyl-Q tRNA(Asp) synthetase